VKIERFTGINNRQPIDRIKPTDAGMPVPDAVNVDLSASGTFQTRAGFELAAAASNPRSMFPVNSVGALVAVGSELMRFAGSSFSKVADLASSYAAVGYTKTPLGIVWSDGFNMGLVKNWINSQLLPAMPNPVPSVSVSAGGALPEGTYGVSFATTLPDGRRSPMTVPVYVDVPEGGRINVSTTSQAIPVLVFCTAVNGDVFYKVTPIQNGAISIGIDQQSGEAVTYEPSELIPPGRVLGFHDGRILSAVGPILYHSQPFSMGLHRPATDFIPFPADIRIIAPLNPGVLIVGTEQSHWLISGSLAQPESMVEIAPYGAVAGTMTEVPNSKALMWFTARGQVSASPSGELSLLQDAQIQFPRAHIGAGVFRETNGMRQYLATLANPVSSGAVVARSFIDARIID
jgi:hypothetical protein